MRDSAVRGGTLRAWAFQVGRRRLLRQGRLLLLVLTVAILASTAVTSVGLLIAATEQSAIRTSLHALPQSATTMSVEVIEPKLSIAATGSRIDKAIRSVLGPSAHATRTEQAYSVLYPTPTPGGQTSLTYFGELAGVSKQVRLTHGVLPTDPPSTTATTIPVAVPDVAAKQLGLAVGSTFSYAGGNRPLTIRVVGTYAVRNATADFWSQDPLRAQGLNANYQLNTDTEAISVNAVGPLLVAPGTLDDIGTLASRLGFDYSPSFQSTDADQLAPLIGRLSTAETDVPTDAGGLATQVTYSADASLPLGQIAAALVVTRSTVVVVTLLLLVLSISALAQAARLFNDARSGDRELMRARGASRGQLLGIAFLEAGVVGILTAGVSAPLARLVYAIIAAQPALVSARVPGDSGLPATAWLTSIGLGILFIAVLLLSLVGRSGSFVSAEQTKSRGRRVSGLLRSGLDVGIAVLAVVAFWQLTIYRSPVGAESTLSVDPLLVAAPALVLLAGSLLAARLFPLVARIVDAQGRRSSGILFRLASWEIGRRSQRATAVVLLLTLSVAVGTFSETFLSTWRQSQVDQANYAVGPPVRVPAIKSAEGAQRSLLVDGASSTPEPVIRRVADVGQDGGGGEDTSAVVLGLTPGARAMLDRGQLKSEGGSQISSLVKGSAKSVHGIALPGAPDGVSAVAQVGDAVHPLVGVGADVVAIIQDDAGLLTTVDLGNIPVDGLPHPISGTLAAVPKGAKRSLPLQVVGLHVDVGLSNQVTYKPNPSLLTRVLVKQFASVKSSRSGASSTIPADQETPLRWNASSADPQGSPAAQATQRGWQLALEITIPSGVQTDPGNYSATAWPTIRLIPVVVSSSLAHALLVKTGGILVLNFARSSIEVQIAGVAPLIPATVDSSLLTASSAAGADSAGTGAVVLDQSALERALVQGGETGSMVDEWWVDVPPKTSASYLAAHGSKSASGQPRSADVLGIQMQQDPLRVATQAALWLAIGAAALLAAIGFAVHSASTLAARRIELAQLRAIGLSRRRLVGLIGVESLILCTLGVLFGVAVGLLLGWLAGPLIALSPNGTPAVPPVRVIVPWLQVGLLAVVVVVVLVAVIAAVARVQRSANPANILREADNG